MVRSRIPISPALHVLPSIPVVRNDNHAQEKNMDTTNKIILVTGATGRQGGAVARHLLNRGFQVRALTRDPDKPAARELAQRGAELIRGNLDNRDDIERALEGAYGIYSVQNFWETGFDREVRQGLDLAEAAAAMNVKHLVYSSVGGAERESGLPHFDSKWIIERHIRDLALPATILRPVFFMENFQDYVQEPIMKGFLPQPLAPNVPLQMIAVDDIGAFAALAFEHPEKWLGREVELASDELTMPQVAEVFTRVLGRPVHYLQVPWDEFLKQAGEENARMYHWFNEHGYLADIVALRQEYPELHTLEQTLRGENWQVRLTA